MTDSPLTLVEARAVLRGIGATIRHHNGEYEVRYVAITHFSDGNGNRRKQTTLTYFTDDLADALATGQAMVARVLARHASQMPGSTSATMEVRPR